MVVKAPHMLSITEKSIHQVTSLLMEGSPLKDSRIQTCNGSRCLLQPESWAIGKDLTSCSSVNNDTIDASGQHRRTCESLKSDSTTGDDTSGEETLGWHRRMLRKKEISYRQFLINMTSVRTLEACTRRDACLLSDPLNKITVRSVEIVKDGLDLECPSRSKSGMRQSWFQLKLKRSLSKIIDAVMKSHFNEDSLLMKSQGVIKGEESCLMDERLHMEGLISVMVRGLHFAMIRNLLFQSCIYLTFIDYESM
eukprot:Gb_09701 [translate_table: standard]